MSLKHISVCLLLLGWMACARPESSQQNQTVEIARLTAQITELKEKLKPGLGEFMTGVQMHHAKLWFAGINQNWKLADFEIGEIREGLEKAAAIETDRPEAADIPMIYPALDSVAQSVAAQKPEAFKQHFTLLTGTCNACHQKNHFEFNVVTIPTAVPVSNQEFRVQASGVKK
jgi:hypothetical protein